MEITAGLLGYIAVGEFVAICMLIHIVRELCKENRKEKQEKKKCSKL